MNSSSNRLPSLLGMAATCGVLALSTPTTQATFTIDGVRSSSETYTDAIVQTTTSNWVIGELGYSINNVLANLHSAQDGSNLIISIGGRASIDNYGTNAILLFIDSKAGGAPFIHDSLIASGGEEYTINLLGTSSTEGMTFEPGFTPDYAIRILGNGSQALVNSYNLQTGVRTDVGDSTIASLSNDFINEISTSWQDVPAIYADANHGVEMSLNLPLLGTPPGAQTVKVMAILVSYPTDFPEDGPVYGSNQVLNSRTSTTEDFGPDLNMADFGTEAGTQTISIPVNYSEANPDGDEDGLLDEFETNTGIYNSPTDTGTSPADPDSDDDTYLDGAEVAGTALGYVSNPNIPNYTNIAVPGTFNLPSPWEPDASQNTPATAMTQISTDLTGQYQWQLDYKFVTSQLGPISYKFSTGSTLTGAWGLGDTPGTVKPTGANLSTTLQATGFHRFYFDQAALTYSFARTVFPDETAFLTAYGLSSGSDDDNDGINNEAEFAANTDPTNIDSDNDGLNDLADPQPLLATRNIIFSLDMNVQISDGNFTPGENQVKALFISGLAAPGELILTDADGDGIYTGTLSGVEGALGTPFGDYRFFNTAPGAPNGGNENLAIDRSFNLETANVSQILPVAYFDNDTTTQAYDAWAGVFTPPPGLPNENPDGDRFSNHAEFLFGTSPLLTNTGLMKTTFTSTEITVRWNQRLNGAIYHVLTSSTLAQESWPPSQATPVLDTDLSDLPAGLEDQYQPMKAVIPISATREFIRIGASE